MHAGDQNSIPLPGTTSRGRVENANSQLRRWVPPKCAKNSGHYLPTGGRKLFRFGHSRCRGLVISRFTSLRVN